MASTRFPRRLTWTECLLAIAALLAPHPALAQLHPTPFDTLAARVYTGQSVRIEPLRALDLGDLADLRGMVFGLHGRVFRNDRIQEWLEASSWYRPDPHYSNSSLSALARENLDRIRQVEAEKHEFIEPGDLRWWQARAMTAERLGVHSRPEWWVLRAEVEAIHGRRFDAEPWLMRYFTERYWYRPDSSYRAGMLSEIERGNLALIDSLQRSPRVADVAPCQMGLFEDRALTEDALRGLDFATLRILRNEIYARHGMTFRALPLAEWFGDRDWYRPRDGVEVQLDTIEQRNVATIAAYERALRDSLHTTPLDPARLDGLFAEDARRLRLEMYARHGRMFRRRWEQDYVASLRGYRPDPGYSDARLSDIERANLAALVAYERTAASVMDAVEG